MKRTNSLLSSFWVKVVPVFLLLVCIGFSNASAQNYKPLGEAISSVNSAIETLKAVPVGGMMSPGGASTQIGGQTTPNGTSAQLIVFEILYYERFIELAKENNSVPAAVDALNAQFPPHPHPTRNQLLTTGKSDLIDLITY